MRISWFFMPGCLAKILLIWLGLLDRGCNVYAPFSHANFKGVCHIPVQIDGGNLFGNLDENSFFFPLFTSYHEANADSGIPAFDPKDLALDRVFVAPHSGGVIEGFFHRERLAGKAFALSLFEKQSPGRDEHQHHCRNPDEGGGVKTGACSATHMLDCRN